MSIPACNLRVGMLVVVPGSQAVEITRIDIIDCDLYGISAREYYLLGGGEDIINVVVEEHEF